MVPPMLARPVVVLDERYDEVVDELESLPLDEVPPALVLEYRSRGDVLEEPEADEELKYEDESVLSSRLELLLEDVVEYVELVVDRSREVVLVEELVDVEGEDAVSPLSRVYVRTLGAGLSSAVDRYREVRLALSDVPSPDMMGHSRD